MFEPVAVVSSVQSTELFVLGENGIFDVDRTGVWAEAIAVPVAEEGMLQSSGNGQIVYDDVTDTIYATQQKLDCILKVGSFRQCRFDLLLLLLLLCCYWPCYTCCTSTCFTSTLTALLRTRCAPSVLYRDAFTIPTLTPFLPICDPIQDTKRIWHRRRQRVFARPVDRESIRAGDYSTVRVSWIPLQ